MTLHAFYTAITLLTVAINPLLNTLRPCCCSQQTDRAQACCQASPQTASESPARPCCQEKSKSSERPHSAPTRGCCCVKSAPAISPARANSVNSDLDKWLLDAAGSLSAFAPAPSDEHLAAQETSRAVSSGPALLARLCVWLK